jgi:sugar (pentulose or hexulose) kinase
MRSLVYSCYATLKLGMDILTKEENVKLERLYAHGGLFKTPVPSQNILSAALGTDVTLMKSAGEGGAWGIAILADYQIHRNPDETLEDYLDQHVFAGMKQSTLAPKPEDETGFDQYMRSFSAYIPAQKAAAEGWKS